MILVLPSMAHGIAQTGQDLQDLFPAGRNKLDGERDAQEPCDMLHVGNQFAPAGALAVEGANRPKPLESPGIGKRRIDDAVNVEVAGRMLAAEATHGQHDVGLVQGAVDQNRLAGLVGRQIGELPAVVRIVDRQRNPLAQRGRHQPSRIAAVGIAAGLAFEHRDSVGIDARIDSASITAAVTSAT